MRKETIKIYQFHELTDEAKQKALEQFYDINVDHSWWDFTYEDAENVGMKLTAFDLDRSTIDGEPTIGALESIEAILENHGKGCDTHTLAGEWKQTFQNAYHALDLLYAIDCPAPDVEEFIKESEEEYFHLLKDKYLSILQKEYEYLTSEEAIIETIEANEYEFTEDGELY
jgi:hypothetical protein